MTYTSGNPTPTTPEAKLANRRWRYLNSWWIFPPVLSFGFLGWLGFMVAAARTGKKNYWIFTGLYAVLLAIGVTLISIDEEGLAGDLALIPILGCWLGATAHAAILNRDYLRTIAAKGNWYQTPQAQPAHQQLPPTQNQPFMGVASSDYYGPGQAATPYGLQPPSNPPAQPTGHPAPAYPARQPSPAPTPQAQPQHPAASGGPVDIGTASVDQLAAVPGIDHALANRLIAIRDARGGYRDLDDLASAANLQPHQLVRIRNYVAFGPQEQAREQHQRPQHGGSGRILDI